VRGDQISRFPRIAESIKRDPSGIPTYIHPRNYLNHAWKNRVLRVAVDLATATRPGDVIVLADEDRFGELYLPDRVVRPIVERDGAYFGPPSNDSEAITELERMKGEGANYLAVGWPAFWWLKHYKRFSSHLAQEHSVVVKNEHVVVYLLGR
jgi:hypothetical protein